MTDPTLKFIPVEPADTPTAFDLDERRHDPRQPATECVTVVRRSLNAFAYHYPLCSMRLRDVSPSGVSAFCEVPLQTGESVSIFFPANRHHSGYETHGTVRRCTPVDGQDPNRQHIIAIEFERAMSA